MFGLVFGVVLFCFDGIVFLVEVVVNIGVKVFIFFFEILFFGFGLFDVDLV